VIDRWKIRIPGKDLFRRRRSDPAPARAASPIPALLDRLRAAGWDLPPPIPEDRVAEAEDALGVRFPGDLREFLLEAGGEAPAGAWRGLWSLEQIASLNRTMPVFRWFGGLVGFGNEGFVVYALDYRAQGLPPVVTVGLSASDPDDIQVEAASFAEWLEATLPPA